MVEKIEPQTDKSTTSTASTNLSQKIIVFAHHKQVLDGIEECLREMRVGYVRIDGSTTTNRAAFISKFQNDDTVSLHHSNALAVSNYRYFYRYIDKCSVIEYNSLWDGIESN